MNMYSKTIEFKELIQSFSDNIKNLEKEFNEVPFICTASFCDCPSQTVYINPYIAWNPEKKRIMFGHERGWTQLGDAPFEIRAHSKNALLALTKDANKQMDELLEKLKLLQKDNNNE